MNSWIWIILLLCCSNGHSCCGCDHECSRGRIGTCEKEREKERECERGRERRRDRDCDRDRERDRNRDCDCGCERQGCPGESSRPLPPPPPRPPRPPFDDCGCN